MPSKNKNKVKSRRKEPKKKVGGKLIVIGGAEDKIDSKTILNEIADETKKKRMVIVTTASQVPEERWLEYRDIFRELNVKDVVHCYIENHQDALDPKTLALFDGAHTIFFTGGDQLKITTKIGGTPIAKKILDVYLRGGLIAGTSAGASAMGKMMLVANEDDESHKVGSWSMAPGLGLLEDILIDQHFAERARLGRLLGAVASNPGILGVGIDEDTAIVIENGVFKVIGKNAVYVIDGSRVSSSNISQATEKKTMSLHNVRLHIMARMDKFDLKNRKPLPSI